MRALRSDTAGIALVETALILPLFLLLVLGCIDLGLFMFQWNSANKAAQRGVREAVVVGALVMGMRLPDTSWNVADELGELCATSVECPVFDVAFTAAGAVCYIAGVPGDCAGSYDIVAAANLDRLRIFARMQEVFPQLQESEISVRYTSNGLGFVGRPGATPCNVTVSINASYNLIALGALTEAWPGGTTCQFALRQRCRARRCSRSSHKLRPPGA